MRSMTSSLPMFNQRSQRHLMPAIHMLALTCMLVLTNGFNSGNSVRQNIQSRHCVVPQCPSRALCPSRQDFNKKSHGISVSARLFRKRLQQEQRQQQVAWNSSRLQMTTKGSSNDVSYNRNPFVKVWLWLRKLLAKIWVSGTYSTCSIEYNAFLLCAVSYFLLIQTCVYMNTF